MANLKVKYSLLFIFILSLTHALAASTHEETNDNNLITIYTSNTEFPTPFKPDEYQAELVNLILPADKIPHEFHSVPHMRSAHLFKANKQSCRMPSNLAILTKEFDRPIPENYIESSSFLHNKIYAFTLAGTPPPRQPSDLDGKRIAVPYGSRYLEKMDLTDIMTVRTQTNIQRTRMLFSGRVDVMLASMPTAQLVFKTFGKPWPVYSPDFWLGEYTSHLSCHTTPRTKKYIKLVNEKIRIAKENGRLHDLLKRHGLSVPH